MDAKSNNNVIKTHLFFNFNMYEADKLEYQVFCTTECNNIYRVTFQISNEL